MALGDGQINPMLGGIPIIGKGLLGMQQYSAGNQMNAANVRPDYEIPPEISQNMNQADVMAMQGLPAEQKAEYMKNIGRSQNMQLQQLQSRHAGIQGIGQVAQTANDAYGGLLAADSQQRMANQLRQMSMRETMANYKDKQFQLNKLDPYKQKFAQSQALMGAGMQNIKQMGDDIMKYGTQGAEMVIGAATGNPMSMMGGGGVTPGGAGGDYSGAVGGGDSENPYR